MIKISSEKNTSIHQYTFLYLNMHALNTVQCTLVHVYDQDIPLTSKNSFEKRKENGFPKHRFG